MDGCIFQYRLSFFKYKTALCHLLPHWVHIDNERLILLCHLACGNNLAAQCSRNDKAPTVHSLVGAFFIIQVIYVLGEDHRRPIIAGQR